jgi:AAA family ATP:ADP antiporter
MLWSAGYFFFLLLGYYLLRPVRDEFAIRGDLENLPWLWTGTTLVMLAATPVFAFVVSRLPRRLFIPWTYRFFGANLAVFWALLIAIPESSHQAVGYVFYVWLSVFNLFAVSVFWGFMADMFTHEQGKRLFGMIAIGGTLGAVCGSAVPSLLAAEIGTPNLLLLSIVSIELAVQCVRQLVRHFGLSGPGRGHPAVRAAGEPGRGVLTGIVLIARSRYLLLMGAYMLLFAVTSTFLFVEQARIIKETVADSAARTAVLARIDLAVNILTLLTQLFLTARVVTRAGVAVALAILPILTIAGFSVLAVVPMLWAVMVFQIARRSLHYAIDRPTREVLYTILGPEEKYKSKSFIDTFVYRGADLLGIWGTLLPKAVGVSGAAMAGAIAAGWLAVAWLLGRRHRAELARHPRPVVMPGPACPACGYSLQGLFVPRCPECGAQLTDAASELSAESAG